MPYIVNISFSPMPEKDFIAHWAKNDSKHKPEIEAQLAEVIEQGRSSDYYAGVLIGLTKTFGVLLEDSEASVPEDVAGILEIIAARYATLAKDAAPVFLEASHDS